MNIQVCDFAGSNTKKNNGFSEDKLEYRSVGVGGEEVNFQNSV